MRKPDVGKISVLLTLLTIILILLGSCSTRKNTFTRRVFHNLTAHYNAFFNGEQALKKGVEKIKDAHTDNFNEILPVFRLADEAAAQSAAPQMDRAVKKAAKVVKKHSMEFHGREYNNWIDDAYLLMGRAHFYKREYLLSKRLFNYVISKYRRRDLIYEAMIWKARVDIIRGNYDQALNSLEQVKIQDRRYALSREAQKLYPKVYAELYIEQQNYDKAIRWLDKGIKENRNKDIRTRLMFIKAQVYQEKGNLAEAQKTFHEVIKKNPSYELTFYSKINIAKSYQAGSNREYDIRTELKELLTDEKNKEYKDVIYYALAKIALKENKQEKGIHYLKKSVSESMNNNRQKAVSSLKLGEIFFDKKEYKLSKAYYDTAVAVLPKSFPDYEEIKNKNSGLSDLVNNLLQIQRQDSLQHIAQMAPAKRERFINKLIEKVKEEEREKRREEQRRRNAMNETRRNQARNQQLGGKGQWYFYNNQTKSFGFTEFQKVWGDRKLEDNWRISQKSKTSMGGFSDGPGSEGGQGMQDSLNGKQLTKKDKAYYMQNLPRTDSAMAASDSLIKLALYNLGIIYQEELKNHQKAVESHEKLIERFPQSKYTLRTYFHLYRNHQKLGNNNKTKEYKNLILKNYPDSDYAMFIKNPDYLKKKKQKTNKAEQFYEKVWKEYQSGMYSNVKTLADTGISRFRESNVAARLALLKAFAVANVEDSTAYASALKEVVKNYKETEQGEKAAKMLAALKKDKKKEEAGKTKGAQSSKEKGYYTFEKDQMQLYVAVFSVKNLSVNKLKVAFSDYNSEFQSLKDLSVNSVYLDSRHQMLTISRFQNAEEGMKYYRGVKNNKDLQKFFENHNGQHFLLSVNDYSRFYKDKNVEKYMEFFKKNYLKKQ